MKKTVKFKFFLSALLFAALALVGCSSSSSTTPAKEPSPQEVPLVEQSEAVRGVVDNYLSSHKITSLTPEELYQIVRAHDPNYFLVDIRANGDFVAGNIESSVSIPYAQTSDPERLANLPKDKILVVIDYNGHLAAQTAATWNLLGYEAVPLLYGVQSWTQDISATGYDPFPAEPLNYPLVTEVKATSIIQETLPEIQYPEGQTQDYLVHAAKTYLNRNYKGIITAEELYDSLEQGKTEQFFLVDIRKPEHYRAGHIEGSINIPLEQLAKIDSLKSFPPDKRLVLIGYNGLDASQGVRCLVTLGYDCVALKYGMSYWGSEEQTTGVAPIHDFVQDHYQLIPLNYVVPSTGAAGCG